MTKLAQLTAVLMIAGFIATFPQSEKPEIERPVTTPSAPAPQAAGHEPSVPPAEPAGVPPIVPVAAPATPPAAPSAPPAGGAVFCPSGTCAPVRQSAGRSYYRPARRGLFGRFRR
jgi:hypothetical protein